MSHVFDGARWVSIPAGIFWASLVTNLYLLLLYTITPALLPVAERRKAAIGSKVARTVNRKSEKAKGLPVHFSFLARVGFIIFLAAVIAQPYNVLLFVRSYEHADRFAAAIQETWHIHPLAHVVTILFCVVMLLPVYFKYRVRRVSRKNFEKEFSNDDNAIRYLREQLGNPTDHGLLSEQILSADINAIRTSDFYFQKTLIEYRIILEEYAQFKETYSCMLTGVSNKCKQACLYTLMPYLYQLERVNPERYDVLYPPVKAYLQAGKVEKYEYWADPPFRTAYRPAHPDPGTQSSLLQSFYAEA
jgi:hypothetical protein